MSGKARPLCTVKAVVLAGGKGRRLLPYTLTIPKPLMPIRDVPILEILLKQMKQAGIEEVVLTVGYLADLFRAHFEDGSRLGLRISYSYEETPLGTAGPLALVNGLDSDFLVANGDVLTTLPLEELITFHCEQGASATIAVHQRKTSINYGVVECDGQYRVTHYLEKPTYDYLVSMGIYVFSPRVLAYIPRHEYLDFPDLVHRLLEAGETVIGYPFDGYWRDLGCPEDYEGAVDDFDKMRSQFLPED